MSPKQKAFDIKDKVFQAGAVVCLAVCLSGCEIAGFTLPDISLPSGFKLPEFDLPFLDETVDPAEALDALSGEPQVTSPTIHESGVLTVGIDTRSVLAPMVITTESSELVGMDIDMAAALADELGLKVTFVAIENIDTASADSVDIVLSVTNDDVKTATVVGSYAEEALGFFHKGEAGVVDVSALSGARVGVQPGSASMAALEDTSLGMIISDFSSLNEAFEALEAGEIDYVLCDAYAGAFLAKSYNDIEFAGTINAPSIRGVAIAASNTSLQEVIQEAIDTLQSNGVLNTIRSRWVGDLPTITTDQQIQNIPPAQTSTPEQEAADSEAAQEDTTADEQA